MIELEKCADILEWTVISLKKKKISAVSLECRNIVQHCTGEKYLNLYLQGTIVGQKKTKNTDCLKHGTTGSLKKQNSKHMQSD